MATKAFQKIYTKISQITKATCSLKASGVGYDELAMVNGKLAQVVKIMGDEVTLQVFEGTEGIPTNAEVVFLGKSPTLKVSEQLAGRFFNAFGDPIDGGPEIEGQEVPIGGPSVNPVRRKQPSELIATGIAGIDLNNTLVSGQKIPFFADPDQPFNQVMANVALRAETDKIILGGMGMTNDDYLYFKNVFSNAGALDRIIRNSMCNIAATQGSHRNNSNGTSCRELHRLFVYLCQIRIKRTRHGVLGRNLVHTIGNDSQRIGVTGHICQ